MLEVDDNKKILDLYIHEGKSINCISNQLGIHRATVKKRITEYELFKELPVGELMSDPQKLCHILLNGQPYDSSNRKPRALTGEVIAMITCFLKSNEEKRLNGFRKQQLRKIDIHQQILEAGYKIDYSTVCKYIRTQQKVVSEKFIKQWYSEGSVCEFDWCEVNLIIGKKKKRFYLAVFTSAFSNYRFAILFERQDTLAFQESHNLFFEHIDGVYHQMVYDNMKVAVKEFVGRDEKKPTAALVSMSSWYQFKWRFCNVRSGNEKGHVERSCDYVRGKAFGPVYDFNTFTEAQDHLQKAVLKLNATAATKSKPSPLELFNHEKNSLHGFTKVLECYEGNNYKIDKYSTFCCKNNHYSVPDNLATEVVFVKLYASHLSIFLGGKEICRHTRSYAKNNWIIDLNHFLQTFCRKPGAIAGSIALNQAPLWLRNMFETYFTDCPRAFAELLFYCRENEVSKDRLQQVLDILIKNYPSSVDKDHILALLGNNEHAHENIIRASLSASYEHVVSQSLQNVQEMTAMMN